MDIKFGVLFRRTVFQTVSLEEGRMGNPSYGSPR
jgi:hypothetical protein